MKIISRILNHFIIFFQFFQTNIRHLSLRLSLSLFFSLSLISHAQDTIKYTGKTLSNPDYHHGQLTSAIGIHNIQVLRANRENPAEAEDYGWTYNHAPMLAYWNNTFWLEYLSDSVGEHVPPGQTLLTSSEDGYTWSKPTVIFPKYKVPDGTTKPGKNQVVENLYAVMHQRMGFYISQENRLLVLGYYGICLPGKDSPNDGLGIGRVVREIYLDGSFGPVYFIRYNASWHEKNTSYPYYNSSKDKGFKKACNELLSNPLMMMQWVEEADRDDPLIPLKKQYKAFSYYHLPDGRVVGLWKHALTSVSPDDGKTWDYPALRAPGFVNANAKIWGERTTDGRYVTVYNPSMFRWPLALSVSDDGLEYKNLLLVQGEISTARYGGGYKNYGPQYVRGILEGNGEPPDSNLWVTYSMNKEDIWVARVPVPIKSFVDDDVDEIFAEMEAGKELLHWNIHSPLWAPVKIEKLPDGTKALSVSDKDRYEYAKAECIFPSSEKGVVEFTLIAAQNNRGTLHVELQDEKGSAAIRLLFDSSGNCSIKDGYRYSGVFHYKPGEEYKIVVSFDSKTRFYRVHVNGDEKKLAMFFTPDEALQRIVFRTGEPRRYPDTESPAVHEEDLPLAGEPVEKAVYYIKNVKTTRE